MTYTATERARIHREARTRAHAARHAAELAIWASARDWLARHARGRRPIHTTRHHSMEA